MKWMFWLLMLVVPLLQATTVNILPTNHNLSDSTHYTLQGFINHNKMYKFYNTGSYNNYNMLLLLPGKHILQTNFIVQNALNFSIHGNNSKIYCSKASVGIAFIKVGHVIVRNIEVINCGVTITYIYTKIATKMTGAMIFKQCTKMNVYGVSIMVQSGRNGMVAINNKGNKMEYIAITTYCTKVTLPSNGILLQYQDYQIQPGFHEIQLSNYKYSSFGLCKDSFALSIATNQTTFNVMILIFDTNFNYLNNSGVLNHHGEACGRLFRSILKFRNCSVEHNKGDNYLTLFHFMIYYNRSRFIKDQYSIGHCNKQSTIIDLSNCTFANNSNMKSILYTLLQDSGSENVIINIKDSIFIKNFDTEILKINSAVKLLWRLTHYINLINTNISSNWHTRLGHSLLSSANGLMFLNHVIIKGNRYESIIQLYNSVITLVSYTEFSANNASFILDSKRDSYYVMREYSMVNITKNFVYSIMRANIVLNQEEKPICHFQFFSNKSDFMEHINENNSQYYYLIELIDNYVYFEPKGINQQSTLYYKDCTFLKNTPFSSTNSLLVYSKVIKETVKYVNKSTVLKTKLLTICPCFNISIYNCNQRYIGTVFPGQTLTTRLMLITTQPFKISFITSFSRTENISQACQVLNPFEIEQKHQNQLCNYHNYTIWSELPECELYLSAFGGVTETLYVKLRACPAGFILHRQKRTCYCDSILYPYFTSCNLNDETILRPANSWISAYQIGQKYEYKISKLCPYEYCLPHSSHLNLSMPDSQCQFHRTGLLCGKCQQGFSTIFGSSQCKHCSNFYLFIIIPIAIAGVMLVMMMFIFNLTITSGIINTFIFYVNIISINYSTFFPECHSIDCLLLSLSNLDLGFEICFYNGMDGYFKALLQLVFPLYLIFIAFVLIIGSRHSVMIQRITSRRALHVLATIFLLSYTKFLLTVCQVLFFYSEIIRLPSKHNTLVWSLDVSVPLFGVKFMIAFLICLVIFIILLHFNILLLFARQLLRFKCVSTFKPLLDAYFGPYKDQFFYWTGLQLILRALFFGLTAFHKNINITVGIVVLGFLLYFQGLMCPFKSRYKNLQEGFVILNLQAVYILALYSDDDNNANIPATQVLILLVLIYFFIVIFYHCLKSSLIFSKISVKMRNVMPKYFEVLKDNFFTSRSTTDKVNESRCVTSNYHELQESIMALDS